ncbi:hypothetical protein HRR83_001372 [Exophiala dermatitidis]|nr:hypothetical protein HRR74_001376 [Exophiala dermatitidis]KAJ4526873.1 hypothetical protein HRR73_001670 [Exophiala dermatitidis]KAJ4532584.1 hypothetical protein HRR76_007572 [Exophiala dermatitidis]KAJ4546906.1 hypothetical protein HRR77_004445 [Exophiala dermatitidis]KAJ4573733.1 hypothetical protein HRR79_002745 [Exophiala dermatitidis]
MTMATTTNSSSQQPNGSGSSAKETNNNNHITIPVPISLTSTNPTLPPATSQALIAHLRATGSIGDLSAVLADSLARTGWTDRVRSLSLELLRNGSCDTFPELMSEVLRRARIPKSSSAENNKNTNANAKNGTTTATNGIAGNTTNGLNGSQAIALSKEWSGGPDGLPDVSIPEATVEVGVDFLKERIKDAVEPVDDDSD